MMNPTMFDSIALEDWYSDDGFDFLLQKELDNYLQNYFPCLSQLARGILLQTCVLWGCGA